MCIQEGPSSFTPFPKVITRCWRLRKIKKYNATFRSLHTHTKFAHTHKDCKRNVSVFESELEFLDPKAITVSVSSAPWPPALYGSVVLAGDTYLAGALQEHCCGPAAAGSTWASPVQLRAGEQPILWLCSSQGLTELLLLSGC